MNAPIDIVISIIKRHKAEVANIECEVSSDYAEGKLDAYQELIDELEGFKRLFN